MTNKELSKHLGLEINSITGRVNELFKKGFVREKRKVKCRFSGFTATEWAVQEGPQMEMF